MQIQQGRIWLSIPLSIPLPSAANSAAGGRRQSMANALSYRMYPMPEGRFSEAETNFVPDDRGIHATRSRRSAS
jgi:hypothetical protein